MTRAPSPGVRHVPGTYVPFRAGPPDRAVAELATRQHGVVSLRQLEAVGLSASAVRKRVGAGRLHRIHRGVYAVGHRRLSGPGRLLAAVLAYGPRAVVSHRSAADLLGLRADRRAVVDISLPLPSVRLRPGIRAHAAATLTAADVTQRHCIPCTAVARTLLDLADVAGRRVVERAVEQAQVLRVFDLRELHDVLERANGRRGVGVLWAILAELSDDAGIAENDLESHFLELCRSAGLPRPAVNQHLKVDDGPAIKADFVWRRRRLVVETDGWGSHGTRAGFENDRLRDQRARLAGWEVVRFSWRQVFGEGARVAETVGALLSR